MIRGTTPTLHFLIDDVNLSGNYRIFMTLRQKLHSVEKTWTSDDEAIEIQYEAEKGTHVYLSLTQEETLEFMDGNIECQAKWINDEGYVEGSRIAQITADKALLQEPIAYGEG